MGVNVDQLVYRTVLAGLLLLAICQAETSDRHYLKPDSVEPDGSGNYVVSYTLNVTLSYGAPSCFARPIVHVSGIFEPIIVINQNDVLRVTVINNIPANYPMVMDGISFHWHGLLMYGPAAWFDGPAYVELCPILSGKSHTFEFQVNETPGTYFFHDHAGALKGDGLHGVLLVYPPRAPLPSPDATPSWPPAAVPDFVTYDEDRVLLVTDWWHATANSQLSRIQAPTGVPESKLTGPVYWIGNPQAILINGHGFYGDCSLPINDGEFHPNYTEHIPCNPSVFTVARGRSAQQPWASSNNPGCTHEEIQVEQGKVYRLRILNSAMLAYLTVCFEQHNVTIVAADAMPIVPYNASCVDVDSGQRLDVLLAANQPASTYWITVASPVPGRVGTPAGYASLRYAASAVASASFPPTPAPQTADIVAPYTGEKLRLASELALGTPTSPPWSLYTLHGFNGNLAVPQTANKLLYYYTAIQVTPQGDGKHFFNNVTFPANPPCKSLLHALRKDPRYLDRMAVLSPNGTGSGPNMGLIDLDSSKPFPVYMGGKSPIPTQPSVGVHVVPLELGQVIDVVIYNFDPFEQSHPIHLHGHRFWVLGNGKGEFNLTAALPTLNTVDPSYRDTATVQPNGWIYFRFVADNPGIWPMHCHILPHQLLGMTLYFVIDIKKTAPPPKSLPPCPKTCRYNYAWFTKSWMRDQWGASGYEVPPLE